MKSSHRLELLLIAVACMASTTGRQTLGQPLSNADQSADSQAQEVQPQEIQPQGDQQQGDQQQADRLQGDQQQADRLQGEEPQDNHPYRLRRRGDSEVDPEVMDLERRMWQRVNQDRVQNGSPPIRLAPQLSNLARKYAQYMMKENFFAHIDPKGGNPETRACAAGFTGAIYENIAWTGRQNSDIDRLMLSQDEMMAEPQGQKNHRSNILVPQHRAIGIGIARNRNKLIMVQEYVDAPADAR